MSETLSPPGQPSFHVRRLYLKDLSFENPGAPETLIPRKEEPKVSFNLETLTAAKDSLHYEVAIHATVNVTTAEGDPLFLCEVTYAGLFRIVNFPKEQLAFMLSVECPHIVFPYVRQTVSTIVGDGGFQPLVLEPINFAALYHQQMSRSPEE